MTFAGVARAGDGARSIEVVPFHSTAMDTNYTQPAQDDSQDFKVWQPTAPNSFKPSSRPAKVMPLQQPQATISKEEQQMLERRRNWVFMTPEDYATTDPKTGKSLLGVDNDKDENMTAMERYFHRLEQSGKPAMTNEFSRLNPERLSGPTNYLDAAVKNTETGMFGQTPFDSTPQSGVFQSSITAQDSGSVFGSSSSTTVQSPEDVRIQAAEKAHMDNFKQLWDIDQASSAATPVASQPSGPIDSAPLFGTSTPGLTTPFKPNLPAPNIPGFSKPATPAPQPTVAPRYTPPPHSDFMPPQRAF